MSAIDELETVAEKARYYASNYPEASDGRNTFIMFTEWVEERIAKLRGEAFSNAFNAHLGEVANFTPGKDGGQEVEAVEILPCPVCGADEGSTYLGKPGPGVVRCFAVGCDAVVGGYSTDEEAIAEWNRRSVAMSAAMTEAFCTKDDDALTECFRHHILTTIGWQAFGARPGPEMQMYEEGFKAGYRRCQSDNEPEFGEEDAPQPASTALVEIRTAAEAYVASVNGEPEKDCWDTEDGKEAPGAERFASDWAWKAYDDKKQAAFDALISALSSSQSTSREGER